MLDARSRHTASAPPMVLVGLCRRWRRPAAGGSIALGLGPYLGFAVFLGYVLEPIRRGLLRVRGADARAPEPAAPRARLIAGRRARLRGVAGPVAALARGARVGRAPRSRRARARRLACGRGDHRGPAAFRAWQAPLHDHEPPAPRTATTTQRRTSPREAGHHPPGTESLAGHEAGRRMSAVLDVAMAPRGRERPRRSARVAQVASAFAAAPVRYATRPVTAHRSFAARAGAARAAVGVAAPIPRCAARCRAATTSGVRRTPSSAGWWQCNYGGTALCGTTNMRYYLDCSIDPGTRARAAAIAETTTAATSRPAAWSSATGTATRDIPTRRPSSAGSSRV